MHGWRERKKPVKIDKDRRKRQKKETEERDRRKRQTTKWTKERG